MRDPALIGGGIFSTDLKIVGNYEGNLLIC